MAGLLYVRDPVPDAIVAINKIQSYQRIKYGEGDLYPSHGGVWI